MGAGSETVTKPTKRPRRKTAQFVLRLAPDQKALLDEAAAASGRTVTDIVTEGARKEALQIVREEREIATWRLSRADAIAFAEALLEPPQPTPQMVESYRAYRESRATRYAPPEAGDADW